MLAQKLNLASALRLASIMDKYVDANEGDSNQDPLEFISAIVEKITPEEFVRCVSILTGETEEAVKKEISIDILTCFIEGLRENKILSLVSFYRSLGLNK